jgi:hypothetical protein
MSEATVISAPEAPNPKTPSTKEISSITTKMLSDHDLIFQDWWRALWRSKPNDSAGWERRHPKRLSRQINNAFFKHAKNFQTPKAHSNWCLVIGTWLL